MLPRVLEPEVMDSAVEARDYDSMDHSQVNRVFVADFLAVCPEPDRVLDVGTGTGILALASARLGAGSATGNLSMVTVAVLLVISQR